MTRIQLETEQKLLEAEESLNQSEEKYRMLIHNLQDGVFIIQDGKMQFVNEAFAKMVGYKVDEIIGMECERLVAPEDLEMAAYRYFRRLAGRNIPRNFQFRMMHKDGITRIMVNMNVGFITYCGRVASMGTVKDNHRGQAGRRSPEKIRTKVSYAV